MAVVLHVGGCRDGSGGEASTAVGGCNGDDEGGGWLEMMIPGESLDEGLPPLISNEDVIGFLEYGPRFREVEVYTKTGVSLVEMHMMERMKSKVKGVVIEEIMNHDVNDAIGKEFYYNEFLPPWSAERMIANTTKRLSDEFEFRKLSEEIDHVFELDNSS
nr:hypothetical protein [Tanacetum cinerariifolium]